MYFEKYRKLFCKLSINTPKNFGKSRRILRNNLKTFENYFLKFWESCNFKKLKKLFWKISIIITGSWRIITAIFGIIFEKFQEKFLKNFAEEKKF